VAEMHTPLVTSLALTETVAVMIVLELSFTVVWPDSGLCTSRMSPAMLAILPDAAGLNAAGGPLELLEPAELLELLEPLPEPAAWRPVATGLDAVPVAAGLFDVVFAAAFPPPPPQAAATSDMTAKVPTARTRRRLLATGTSRLFTGVVPPVFLCFCGFITRCGAPR
jgi:hypothetical protein